MADTVLLYVTCRDADEAAKIGEALVQESLAACANILPGIRSIYRWEGRLEHANEAVLILKTRLALADDATVRVKALHSYQVPAILVLPVEGGNRDYLNWINAQLDPRLNRG